MCEGFFLSIRTHITHNIHGIPLHRRRLLLFLLSFSLCRRFDLFSRQDEFSPIFFPGMKCSVRLIVNSTAANATRCHVHISCAKSARLERKKESHMLLSACCCCCCCVVLTEQKGRKNRHHNLSAVFYCPAAALFFLRRSFVFFPLFFPFRRRAKPILSSRGGLSLAGHPFPHTYSHIHY